MSHYEMKVSFQISKLIPINMFSNNFKEKDRINLYYQLHSSIHKVKDLLIFIFVCKSLKTTQFWHYLSKLKPYKWYTIALFFINYFRFNM